MKWQKSFNLFEMRFDSRAGLRKFSTDFLYIHNIWLALITYDNSSGFNKKLPLAFEKLDFLILDMPEKTIGMSLMGKNGCEQVYHWFAQCTITERRGKNQIISEQTFEK